jgi:hypothetical protein
MLVVGGKHPAGQILHVIVGPESELHMDIHGAKIIDLTPILSQFEGNEHVYMSLTRCRGEVETKQRMNAQAIPYISSFTPPAKEEVEDKPSTVVNPQAPANCTYCGSKDKPLLPVPGFRICPECVQIELGRQSKRTHEPIVESPLQPPAGLS